MIIRQSEPSSELEGWYPIIVYGSFRDPDTGKGFFLVRVPSGRKPWTKKIAPAINRVVFAMFSKQQVKRHFELIRDGREGSSFGAVKGLSTIIGG